MSRGDVGDQCDIFGRPSLQSAKSSNRRQKMHENVSDGTGDFFGADRANPATQQQQYQSVNTQSFHPQNAENDDARQQNYREKYEHRVGDSNCFPQGAPNMSSNGNGQKMHGNAPGGTGDFFGADRSNQTTQQHYQSVNAQSFHGQNPEADDARQQNYKAKYEHRVGDSNCFPAGAPNMSSNGNGHAPGVHPPEYRSVTAPENEYAQQQQQAQLQYEQQQYQMNDRPHDGERPSHMQMHHGDNNQNPSHHTGPIKSKQPVTLVNKLWNCDDNYVPTGHYVGNQQTLSEATRLNYEETRMAASKNRGQQHSRLFPSENQQNYNRPGGPEDSRHLAQMEQSRRDAVSAHSQRRMGHANQGRSVRPPWALVDEQQQ